MDNKKKQCLKVSYKLFYLVSFFTVLNICLFGYSAISFAFTEEQYENIVNDSILKINENFNITLPSADTLTPRDTTAYNNFINNLGNYDKFGSYVWSGSTVNDINFRITFFTSLVQEPIYLNNNYRLYEYDATTLDFQYSSGQILVWINNNTSNFFQFYPYANTQNNLYHDFSFYLNNGTTPYEANYQHVEVDSITLTAMHSGDKFTFNNKNQLKVTFTGNYTITDFNYGILKYNTLTESWEDATGLNDWYYLADYNNPFYVYFSYMNYLKAGTYKYFAQYDGENSFSVWSDNFEITTNSLIDTGTYENGNISIDTGNSSDDMKDFLGSPADFNSANVTIDDLDKSMNIKETVNPYDNFLMTFINGLIASLTGPSKDFTFKIHTWGDEYTVKVSDIVPQYGPQLTSFFRIMSCFVFGFVLIKWVTKLVESVNVADVGTTLELVEEKYSDLL